MEKPRYDILDGLRGVAALCVLVTHLFEAVAFANGDAEQNFYHGFLAVDFFFLLSGFVMGYAYDDKLRGKTYLASKGNEGGMTVWQFFKRRLIRLHPMVVIGVLFGVVCFVLQGSVRWDGTEVPLYMLLGSTLLSLCLLPCPLGMDVRGNTEAFPLNGPHWSLFFEYLGNVLYVLLFVKMPTKVLRWWVTIAAFALLVNTIWFADGYMGNGWSSEPSNLFGGALRILFAYPMGLLMARYFREAKPGHTRLPAFLISSVAIVALLLVPSISTLTGWTNANGFYQVACSTILFPQIIFFGARGVTTGVEQRAVSFLGRLSYPLYAIHYPLIYMYIHWIKTGQHPFGSAPWATPVAVGALALTMAVLVMLFYDEPLRRWLSRK